MPSAVTLLLGDEELLVGRAVAAVVNDLSEAADGDVDVRDLAAADVEAGELAELLSPSLFAGESVVVLRAAEDLDDAARDLLLRYLSAPLDGTALVLTHAGGQKGKRFVDAVTASGAAVQRHPKLTKPAERLLFVQGEFRAHDRASTAGACKILLDAVGNDLRELAAAVAQLVADAADVPVIDERVVLRFRRGRAETTGFQIADAAVAGDTAGALALLRSALQSGTPELLVIAALAGAVRELAAVRGAGSGSAAVIARQLGLPPWKVEKALRGGRGWTEGGLAAALTAVARADLLVKGAGVSGGYALEQAVIAVAGSRAA